MNDLYFRTHGDPGYFSDLTWRFGQLGVIIFFVHTSFVLMLSLERYHAEGWKLIRDFYIRRFFRIYPLAAFCTTLVMLFPITLTFREWSWSEYLASMTLTTNLFLLTELVGPMWTLCLEVQMYVVLPFLFMFARSRSAWLITGVWLLSVIAGIIQPSVAARLNVLEWSPCFIAGVMGWRVSLNVRRSIAGWVWPLLFVALWTIFLAATRDQAFYFRWAFCLALGLAIPFFQEMRLGPLNSVAHVLAKYSFGIYLAHGYIQYFAFTAPVSLAAQMALVIAGSFAIPYLMFHLIERPMIKAGGYLVIRMHNLDSARQQRLRRMLSVRPRPSSAPPAVKEADLVVALPAPASVHAALKPADVRTKTSAI